MKITIILCALLCVTCLLHGQPVSKNFNVFAKVQDSLFMKAYERKNTTEYNRLLDQFLVEYNRLNSDERKTFVNYYINAYYNLCCTYSLLHDTALALRYFNKCIQAGYTNYYHIKEDSDLNTIRHETQFVAIAGRMQETEDYLYIIKKAGVYNTADKRDIPLFTYQPSNNPNLVALRKSFNLDSVAGYGNEVSKILNMLHWVHNLVPHDGSHENPVVKNAMSMITICKKENRGLNCRGMATVLNECFLSMGIPSRFVTCLPKDSLGVDNDCHVINMVYAASLKKWLWIDPTFDAYIMNDKGELLSIEEVRESIVNNRPLILNPEANWNHKVSETKEYYLYYYMAKNLYRLECPLQSEYDTETREPGKKISYVQLIPLDYFKQPAGKTISTNMASQVSFIYYPTNNPASFWNIPGAQ